MLKHSRTNRKCSYSYIHNTLYKHKQKHGIHKATISILSKKWRPTQMIKVYNNLNILFSTQFWPHLNMNLYMRISRLSSIHDKRIKKVSATTIQRSYIRHLYKPTHEWHVRTFKNDFSAFHLNVSNIVL